MSVPYTKTVVVGQGYVGLPVAMRAVAVGHDVVGLEIDKHRVSELSAGRSYVGDVSNFDLRAALRSGRYTPTDAQDALKDFTFLVITVPTPLREKLPDLSFIEEAARCAARYLTVGSTVILESTTYPGTTEEVVVPLLETGSGLQSGIDFFVGYSPERIDPGNSKYGFTNTPKVVSGVGREALVRIEHFYNQLVDRTVPVSSPKEAELTKLLENTFRHVNIALVNELAVFAHQLGIDIWESIDAATTKPFGYMRFTPGPGVGGHCLPVDPSYLSWQVRRQLGQNFRFIELANDVNDHMPDYVVQRVTALLNNDRKSVRGSNILLVGLSYKKNTGDIRESPALRIIELLSQLGAELSGVDPHVEDYRWPQCIQATTLSSSTLESTDLAILVTEHDGLDLELLERGGVIVLDTRNCLKGPRVSTI